MIRKTLIATIAALLVPAAGWSVDFDGAVSAEDIQAQIAQVEVALPAAAAPAQDPAVQRNKDITIMVYVNSKNDLERFGLKDMNEMEMIGSSDRVNVVVQMGRMAGHDASEGDWRGTRRYLVQRDTDTTRVTSPIVEDMGTVDMGDWRQLVAFGRWAKQNYPANKYMLVVWNHGDGWLENRPAATDNKGISYDEETGNHLTTPELAAALRDIGGVDVYGSDACLMQMAEVVYELKDHARFIVGSEETEPGDGYTYDLFLGPIVANPAMSAEQMARVAVDGYSDHYRDIRQGSTQSYIKTAEIAGFTRKVNAFAAAVMASGEKEVARTARGAAMKYAIRENKDLYDFARLVSEGSQNEAVRTTARELMENITGRLVGHNRTNNQPAYLWFPAVDYSASKGIAAYFPSGAFAPGYNALAWAGASQWDEFAAWMNQP
jgi:hypothetical protein